jgi:hypothetical protein
VVENPKLELHPHDGVLYKFFDGYRLLRADVALAVELVVGDLVVAHHPDPEIGPLCYKVTRIFQVNDGGLWTLAATLTGDAPSWGARAVPKNHDYTESAIHWGHNLYLSPRQNGVASAMGWGVGLRVGDLVRVSRPKPVTYLVESLDYEDDPPDLWRATLTEKTNG